MAFNCNKKPNNGTNVINIPTKTLYVQNETFSTAGMRIVKTQNGTNTIMRTVSELNKNGMYLCMMNNVDPSGSFVKLTDSTKMPLKNPTNGISKYFVYLTFINPQSFTDLQTTSSSNYRLLYTINISDTAIEARTSPLQDSDGDYVIYNKAQLKWYNDNAYSGSYYNAGAKLMNDIVFNEGDVVQAVKDGNTANLDKWTPRCIYGKKFDGQGHTISGLYINGGSYPAFIYYAQNGASIENLGIINSAYETANATCAGIAGYIDSSSAIKNCYVNIHFKRNSDSARAAGISAICDGKIINCYSVCSGDDFAGITYTGYSDKVENSYYQNTTRLTGGTKSTEKRFASGEITYLLNNGEDTIWYQNLDNGKTVDPYPVFNNTHGIVYKVTNGYSNNPNAVLPEIPPEPSEFVNGFSEDGRYEEGEYKQDGYYYIYNAGQLYWFTQKWNNGERFNVKLADNIVVNDCDVIAKAKSGDISDLRQWTPINNYNGIFDGQGHTISGLCYSGTGDVGMFANLIGAAEVKNVGIINSYFKGTNYVGGIAGYLFTIASSVKNCYTQVYTESTNYYCGGIAAFTNGTISNCYAIDDLSGSRLYGIANCSSDGTVKNCYYLNTNAGSYNPATSVQLTKAQFANGYAAYMLNTNGDNIWYQNIDNGKTKDEYPVFDNTHGTVYKVTGGYSNNPNAVVTTVSETTTETTTAAPTTTTQTTTEKPTETTTSAHVSYDSNGFGSDGSYQSAVLNNDAYEISNAGQLYWYAAYINNGGDKDAKLTKDITVNSGIMTSSSSGARAWTPIAAAKGHQDGVFYKNTFDGQGHTVSGLYVGSKPFFAGMFGCIASGGTVKNLGVVNSYFSATKGAGAISGGNSNLAAGGTILNCYSKNNEIKADDNAGGIVGGCWQAAYIKNCYVLDCSISGSLGFSMPISGYFETNGTAASEKNCYYGNIGGNFSDDNNATKLTKAQFESGEAAYKLNTGDSFSTDVWYQNIDNGKTKDTHPVLDSTHGKVYAVTGGYSNTETAVFTTETTTETTTQTTTEKTTEGTTNAGGYDSDGFDSNGNCQPAVDVNGTYEIGNMGQLYWYADYINSGNKKDARLVADIVFNEGKYDNWGDSVYGWTPIANATDHGVGVHYTNTFDGQGHTISGLYCRCFEQNKEFFFAGLFGCLSTGAEIKNLGVINSYFYSTKASGAIAGGGSNTTATGGTISNCWSAYNIIYSTDNAGGIVGGAWKGTTVKDCFTAYCQLYASNSSASDAYMGVMAGYIAKNEGASVAGGKYIGITTSSNGTKNKNDTSTLYSIGDANLDGEVNILDAIKTQNITFDYSDFSSYTADIDKNEKITSADTSVILKNIIKQ